MESDENLSDDSIRGMLGKLPKNMSISKTPFPSLVQMKGRTSSAHKETPRTLLKDIAKEKASRRSSILPIEDEDRQQRIIRYRKSKILQANMAERPDSEPETSPTPVEDEAEESNFEDKHSSRKSDSLRKDKSHSLLFKNSRGQSNVFSSSDDEDIAPRSNTSAMKSLHESKRESQQINTISAKDIFSQIDSNQAEISKRQAQSVLKSFTPLKKHPTSEPIDLLFSSDDEDDAYHDSIRQESKDKIQDKEPLRRISKSPSNKLQKSLLRSESNISKSTSVLKDAERSITARSKIVSPLKTSHIFHAQSKDSGEETGPVSERHKSFRSMQGTPSLESGWRKPPGKQSPSFQMSRSRENSQKLSTSSSAQIEVRLTSASSGNLELKNRSTIAQSKEGDTSPYAKSKNRSSETGKNHSTLVLDQTKDHTPNKSLKRQATIQESKSKKISESLSNRDSSIRSLGLTSTLSSKNSRVSKSLYKEGSALFQSLNTPDKPQSETKKTTPKSLSKASFHETGSKIGVNQPSYKQKTPASTSPQKHFRKSSSKSPQSFGKYQKASLPMEKPADGLANIPPSSDNYISSENRPNFSSLHRKRLGLDIHERISSPSKEKFNRNLEAIALEVSSIREESSPSPENLEAQPSSDTEEEPLIEPEREPAKKRKKTSENIAFMPDTTTRNLMEFYGQVPVQQSAVQEANHIVNSFWRDILNSLDIYANHAGRKSIKISDAELYLFRLRYCHDRYSMNALIDKYLPADMQRDLVPVAQARQANSEDE